MSKLYHLLLQTFEKLLRVHLILVWQRRKYMHKKAFAKARRLRNLQNYHSGAASNQLKDVGRRVGGRVGCHQVVTKRCHLSWLTNSVLVYKPKYGGRVGDGEGLPRVSANEDS